MTKKDFTQVAFDVVQQATDEKAKPPAKTPRRQDAKTPRQEASRKGGLKGGAKRAEKLTPEERSEIAKKAAQGRWSKN